MSDIRFVYVTAPSREEATTIGRELIAGKLAACVNILGGAKSIYQWEGQIEEAEEAILIAKTDASRFPQLESVVKNLHSYECPAIISLEVKEGSEAYLKWIIDGLS